MSEARIVEHEPDAEYLRTLHHTAALVEAVAFDPTTVFGGGEVEVAEHAPIGEALGPGVVCPPQTEEAWRGSVVTISAVPLAVNPTSTNIYGYSSWSEQPLRPVVVSMRASDGTAHMAPGDERFRIELRPDDPTATGITPEGLREIQITRCTPFDAGVQEEHFTLTKDQADFQSGYVEATIECDGIRRRATAKELLTLQSQMRSFGERHAAIRDWEAGRELARALDEARSMAALKATLQGLGRLVTGRKKIEERQSGAAQAAADATYLKLFMKHRFGWKDWQADHPIAR